MNLKEWLKNQNLHTSEFTYNLYKRVGKNEYYVGNYSVDELTNSIYALENSFTFNNDKIIILEKNIYKN